MSEYRAIPPEETPMNADGTPMNVDRNAMATSAASCSGSEAGTLPRAANASPVLPHLAGDICVHRQPIGVHRRSSAVSLSICIIVLLLLALPAPRPQAAPSPLGVQQVMLMIGQYRSTSPRISLSRWVGELNERVNEYYSAATGNRTRWAVSPAPAITEYGYGDNGTFDDSQVIFREGIDALRALDDRDPEFWARSPIRRFVVVVTANKRGRASQGVHFVTRQRGMVKVSLAIIPEPQQIDDNTISLFCHELGHQLGLPDLYLEPEQTNPYVLGGDEFTGGWDLMAIDSLQHFGGWCRRHLGWIDAGSRRRTGEKKVISRPLIGNLDQTVVLSPPQSGGPTQLLLLPLDEASAIRTPGGSIDLPINEGGTAPRFNGYMLEARSYTGAEQHGLPKPYRPGVLITRAARRFINPSVVVPRLRLASDFPDVQLQEAAWRPGDTFGDAETGLSVEVVREVMDGSAPEGSFEVRVRWTPPPRADVVAADIWLDSPHNGFSSTAPFNPDNYHTPIGSGGTPERYGDPIFVQATPFGPIARTHNLHVRVRNEGAAPAGDVRGTVFICSSELTAMAASLLIGGPILAQGVAVVMILLADMSGADIVRMPEVSFGSIAPGQTVDRAILWRTVTPFWVVMVVEDRAPPPGQHPETQLHELNNIRFEGFAVTRLAFGSPYPPVDLTLPVTNPNDSERLFYATPLDLPEGWTGFGGVASNPSQLHSVLGPRESETFRVLLQPPDPRTAKPGQSATIGATIWMDYGDSYVPVGELPVHVALNYPTVLGMGITDLGTGKATLQGRLVYHDVNSLTEKPVKNAPILLSLAGDDGSLALGGPENPALTATTDGSGFFTKQIDLAEGVTYQAVAQYGGSATYHPAVSAPVTIGPRGVDLAGSWIAVLVQTQGRGRNVRQIVKASYSARNQGPDPLAGATVQYLLSTDDKAGDDDLILGTAATGALGPGGRKTMSLTATLPLGTQWLGKHVLAVLDPGGAVSEIVEDNNVVVYGPLR